VGWDTECPDEYVEAHCRLLSGFNAQVPLGDLALQDSEWTPGRLRAWEARNREIGRHSFSAGAVGADSPLVGTSEIRVDEDAPSHGTVGITLVAPDHRGHRLGFALKMAATDLALEHFPDLEHVETSNADSNTHMNAVNERLGYRPHERLLEFQKVL
jgi:RimJ/RimL family protein N-acetyltransferase